MSFVLRKNMVLTSKDGTLEGQEAADAEESQTPEEEQPTDTEE